MKREEMREYLLSLDPSDRYPLWIISHKRAGTAPFLNRIQEEWKTAGDVNVLVLESQREVYEKAYPRLNIVSAEDEEVNTVGKARWLSMVRAYYAGADELLVADDDVLSVDFLYESAITKGPNKGKESSRNSNNEDREAIPNFEERIFAAMTDIAEDVFADNKLAMLGGLIKRHMNFAANNHKHKYIINGGVTPRQVMVANINRMREYGIALNLDLFSVHGDDIGMVAEILKAGADCFAIPSFAYDHWPESVNITESTLRNAETAPALHALEYEGLMQYPIKDYMRTKNSVIDGSFEWADVNWQKAAKLRGRPTLRVLWDDPEDLI